MINKVYKKEKARNKKESKDLSEDAISFLRNSEYLYSLTSPGQSFRHYRSDNVSVEEIITIYFFLCEKYKKPIHYNKKTKLIKEELIYFKDKETKSILRKNTKNKKIILLIFTLKKRMIL